MVQVVLGFLNLMICLKILLSDVNNKMTNQRQCRVLNKLFNNEVGILTPIRAIWFGVRHHHVKVSALWLRGHS